MENLGIQPISLLAQIFNFTVLVFLLNKVLYKPILKMLDDRKKKIAEGLSFSEKAKVELEKSEKKGQEIVSKAKAEAKKIIDEGKKSAKLQEQEIVNKAQKEGEAIVMRAKKEIEDEKKDQEKKLERQAVEIAEAMVEKVLGRVLNTQDHKNIIENKLKEFKRLAK